MISENGQLSRLTVYETTDVRFYNRLSPANASGVEVTSWPRKERGLIKKAEAGPGGSVLFIGDQLLRLDKSTIHNAGEYFVGDHFHLSEPDTLYTNQVLGNRLLYFATGMRERNLWYIGFCFENNGQHFVRAFVSHDFAENYVNIDSGRKKITLTVGKGNPPLSDTVRFSRYEIDFSGDIKKVMVDSLMVMTR